MMYVLALILPPVSLLVIGKVFQGLFNLIVFVLAIVLWVLSLGIFSFITFPLWILAVVHALFVVHNHRTDNRLREIARDAATRPNDR